MTPDLDQIHRYLETKYPEEGCGVVFAEADGTFSFQPMDNAYDKYHSKDPATYPRNNRTAYLFSPMEFHRLSEASDARGAKLWWIVHSHCDVGSYFSAEDKAMAAPEGQALLPDTAYLVVAVDHGQATKSLLFKWDGANFLETPILQK